MLRFYVAVEVLETPSDKFHHWMCVHPHVYPIFSPWLLLVRALGSKLYIYPHLLC